MPNLQSKMYFPSGGLNSDTNSLYVKDTEFTGVTNLRIKPNSIQTRNGCKAYGNSDVTTPATSMRHDGNATLHFHAYKIPNGNEEYFAFTKNNVYKYNHASTAWTSVLDSSVTFSATKSISLWSTTDFIDSDLGPTVIAACSIPVSDISAEEDATYRKLLYYDTLVGSPTYGKFTTLVLSENIDVVGEHLYSQTVHATVGIQTETGTLTNVPGTSPKTNTLYPGSFILSTDELGVVAYSEATPISVTISGTPTNVYPFIPVDQSRVQAGANSYISVDGTKLSVNWLTTDYANLQLKCSYTYQEPTGIKPRYVRGYYNRLLLASTAELDGSTDVYYPWRVRWTEVGNRALAKFTSYQDLIDTDVSPITGWEEQGFYLTIVKRNCLYKISHVGGDLVFLFQVAWKHGCPNGKTLKNFNSMQYFVGEDDLYKWDGSTLTSITLDQETGNYRVKNAIMGMITFANVGTIFSSLDLVNKEYWLWIPGTSSTTVWIYSMSYNTWTKFVYENIDKIIVTCANLGRVETTSSGTYAAAIGSYETYAGTMEESAETLDKIQFFGTSSGLVYVSDEKVNLDFASLSGSLYTGTTIPSYLITKDFTYNDVYSMDRTQRVELDLYGTECVIGWDGNFNLVPTTFKNFQTIALTNEWLRRYYYPDCVCYQVRFCINSTEYISMRLINLYALTSRLTNR